MKIVTTILLTALLAFVSLLPERLGAQEGATLIFEGDGPWLEISDISVAGQYVHAAAPEGLLVIDVSDPASPALLSTVDIPDGSGLAVAVVGAYAYVATGWSGLHIVDLADPLSPISVGHCDIPGFACDITISGSYAVVAAGLSGLQIVDVSKPTSPRLVANLATSGYCSDLTVTDNLIYAANIDSGLQIVDITDVPTPTLIGTVPGEAAQVAVGRGFALVADARAGLNVVDVFDPASSSISASYESQDCLNDIAIDDHYAFLAEATAGLLIIDISDPLAHVFVGGYSELSEASCVTVSGDRVYVADRDGLVILSFHRPASVEDESSSVVHFTISAGGTYPQGNYLEFSDPGPHASIRGIYHTPGFETFGLWAAVSGTLFRAGGDREVSVITDEGSEVADLSVTEWAVSMQVGAQIGSVTRRGLIRPYAAVGPGLYLFNTESAARLRDEDETTIVNHHLQLKFGGRAIIGADFFLSSKWGVSIELVHDQVFNLNHSREFDETGSISETGRAARFTGFLIGCAYHGPVFSSD